MVFRRGGALVKSVLLKFEHIDSSKNIELELFSKFTCINGKDSGEGKTEFLAELEQGIQLGEITCNLGGQFCYCRCRFYRRIITIAIEVCYYVG